MDKKTVSHRGHREIPSERKSLKSFCGLKLHDFIFFLFLGF